ncbi:MAG: pilus assembly protein [bacterium]|nr:pilus assembly protein [bacterium]
MSLRSGAHAQRGQTLIEMVIALPVILIALFGIIYVARVGVVNERAQLALRYGGIAGFITGSNAYSAANIYENLSANGMPQPCPTPAMGALTGASPFPEPSAAPFWQPDTAASAPCTPTVYGLGGAQFLASHYFSATSLSISGGVDVPSYIQDVLGETSHVVGASEAFVHPAFPGMILYCSTEVRARVYGAVTASGSSIPPTPIPNGASNPSPAPNNNGVCQ